MKKIYLITFFVSMWALAATNVSAANPFRVHLRAEPDIVFAGQETQLIVSVENGFNTVSNALIDIEIFAADGQQVFQHIAPIPLFERDHIATVTTTWTPAADGIYMTKVGVFTNQWAELLYWENYAGDLAVGMAPPRGDMILIDTAIRSEPYYLAQQAVITAALQSFNPPSQTLAIDLELWNDETGALVTQQVFDPIRATSTLPMHFSMRVPRQLPGGRYVFKVGVFTADWRHVLHWYDRATVLHLTETGEYEDGRVVIASTFTSPTPLQSGQLGTIGISIMSPFSSNHVLIDMELYNEQGQQVQQRVYDDVSVPRSGIGNYENIYTMQTDSSLPPGQYTLKVGIFRPSWGDLIEWYNHVLELPIE